jgi:hypothetical protein
MLLEVKSNQRAYQKSKKQLFDGIERLQDVFATLGITTHWPYVGVFFALIGGEEPLFECEDCSIFAIIGEEMIPQNFRIIEEEVSKRHQSWKPKEHVQEFVELIKQILFICQGDPFAPVTGSNIINKTVQYVERAGRIKNIFFWTLDQLSIVQAMELLFVLLDSFYSTGKTIILKYHANDKLKKGEVVHYFNQRPTRLEENSSLLPFTLMLINEFHAWPGVVKETNFQFGINSVKGFLLEHGIESTHHVIFDEVICTKYTKGFLASLIAMKDSVASLWVAMGAQPVTGKNLF